MKTQTDFARIIAAGFEYDPGHSDLDNEQPIHVRMTLGDWREAAGKIRAQDIPWTDLKLSVRAYNCITDFNYYNPHDASKIVSIADLASFGARKLYRLKYVGKATVNEIRERLTEKGLDLAA